MASAASVSLARPQTSEDGSEDVDDEASLLECLSCNEQEGFLINPKSLHCSHTFCVTCLGNHCVDDVITCYKCGEKTVSCIEDLPSALKKPTFCNTCERIDKIQYKTASMYCVECDRKYCASHFKVHNSVNDHHQMLTIQNYLKSYYAQEMRFCEIHKDRILSMGCRQCWMVTCAKCITSTSICKEAEGYGGNKHHNLISIEEVAEELRASVEPVKTAAEDKFDEIAALVKEITILLSDWDTETEHAVRLIHQTRDQQIAAIEEKYAKLESNYTESRSLCKEKITSYIADEAGRMMSDFLQDMKTLRSSLSDQHPATRLPVKTKPKTERREPEIELLPVDDHLIFGDKLGGIFKTPPSSLELVMDVKVGDSCPSVCFYKGYTYVGQNNGRIDRVDDQGSVTSFINHGYGYIISVRAHEDQLYVVAPGSPSVTIYVNDMAGKQLRSWQHSDTNRYPFGGKIVIANEQLVVADSSNKQIVKYDRNAGSVLKTIRCPQITANNHVAMCEGGGDSVVISDYGSSKVFKLNLTTEVIEWTSTHVQNPEGVTLLGPHHVAVSYYGSGMKVWILNLQTGEMVRELTDTSITNTSHVSDLYLDKDILIIPRHNHKEVLYYKLK